MEFDQSKLQPLRSVSSAKAEFIAFLKGYGVVGLAIGVVAGGAVNKFVAAIVSSIINPLLGLIVPGGSFASWTVGPFLIGELLLSTIEFLAIMLVIFCMVKMITRLFGEDVAGKK